MIPQEGIKAIDQAEILGTETERNDGLNELLANVKKWVGEDFIDSMKDFPIIGKFISNIFDDSTENREELKKELPGVGEKIKKKLHRYFDSFLSEKSEKSASDTALCSKTARLNLEKLVKSEDVLSIAKGGSAKEAYVSIGSPKNNWEDLIEDDSVNVIDCYLDASEKNSDFGHRCVAVRTHEGFKILDPYYNVANGVNGVDIHTYMEYMKNVKGRKIWGAMSYT